MINLRAGSVHALRCIDFNDIEPGLLVCGMLLQIEGCRGAEPLLLGRGDKFSRCSKTVRSAELYLCKNQIPPIFGNQIDLSEPAGKPGTDDFVVLFPQIICGQGLSPGAQKLSPAGHRIFSESSGGEWRRGRTAPEPDSGHGCRSPCESQSRTGDTPGPASP